MIAKFFIIFIAVLLVLGAIGLWMRKRGVGRDAARGEDPMSEANVENVNDLGDRFNRARYMDEDGK